MGSEKERGKGGSYVKYLALPCLPAVLYRTWTGLATSFTLNNSTPPFVNEIFSAQLSSDHVALINSPSY
jgi:hypothetical protein